MTEARRGKRGGEVMFWFWFGLGVGLLISGSINWLNDVIGRIRAAAEDESEVGK